MLKSIVTGCHWLTGPMLDAGAQIEFVSVLTLMNLAILARSVCPHRDAEPSKAMFLMHPLEIWLAVNVSILLWLLCLVIIRMITQ